MAYLKNNLLVICMLAALFMSVVRDMPAKADGNMAGTVVETLNSGGYTYVNIENQGKRQWVAIPQVVVQVGDNITLYPGMQMGSYTSPTLGRTFDGIIFSPGLAGVQRSKDVVKESANRKEETVTVAKAKGPDSYRIAELYSSKKELSGKSVVVKGQVLKVSTFQGKKWIRIIDGSGSRKRGNHQLVAISEQDTKVGEIITLRGVLAVDISYGALTYELLLDQTKLERDAK